MPTQSFVYDPVLLGPYVRLVMTLPSGGGITVSAKPSMGG